MQINVPDIDEMGFAEFGYTIDTFFSDADSVAEFICSAYRDGFDFIFQCQFGFSRSAACAAAILEYFEGRGNEILLSENYQPNKIIYNKLLYVLEKESKRKQEV